jgi:hypothetical protein
LISFGKLFQHIIRVRIFGSPSLWLSVLIGESFDNLILSPDGLKMLDPCHACTELLELLSTARALWPGFAGMK